MIVPVSYRHFWTPFSSEQFESRFPFIENEFGIRFQESETPKIIFFSSFVNNDYHEIPKITTKAVKVFYQPENIYPNMDLCDFAIGSKADFDHPNYLYLPPFLTRLSLNGNEIDDFLCKNIGEKKEFCNFIYTNEVPFRNLFFDKLSLYKKISSPSTCRNNFPGIGKTIRDKIRFQSDYKFSISFENSDSFGYVSEKITDSMLAGSIPIYWGCPKIDRLFNKNSFVWVKDGYDISRAIEQIKFLDNDHDAYSAMTKEPWFENNEIPDILKSKRIKKFFRRIFKEVK